MGMPDPCEDTHCTKPAEFECEWCTKWFCRLHIYSVGDNSLRLCGTCKTIYENMSK